MTDGSTTMRCWFFRRDLTALVDRELSPVRAAAGLGSAPEPVREIKAYGHPESEARVLPKAAAATDQGAMIGVSC